MILSIGEILADMIGKPNGEVTAYECYVGGAPFDVACAVKKFGGCSGFYGVVGEDIIGTFLRDFANNVNFDLLQIDMLNDRNTTLAFVKLSQNGEREFCFYRKHTADYCHSLQTAKNLMQSADIVHIGSLALSEDKGAEFCNAVAHSARLDGKKISFDVNFRHDLFGDDIKRFGNMIAQSDIIKVSEDELIMLTGMNDIHDALANMAHNNQLVVVTIGERGSAAYYNGSHFHADSIKVSPVDTTGAGDAFYAGFLTCLDGRQFTPDNINYALKFGNVCGALTCTGYGAVNSLPDYKTIISKL